MGAINPYTARTEIRQDRKGRLAVYFDGVAVPGVMRIVVSGENGQPTDIELRLAGAAVRLTQESEAS